jgi:hypothetical protein
MEYPEELSTVCQLCGNQYEHLGSHIWHRHKILARTYKEEFGLPYDLSLVSKEVYQKKLDGFERNREKCLKNLSGHEENWFKKGKTGQRRISFHEKQQVMKRILKVNELRKTTIESCPVCRMQFSNINTHLLMAHKLLQVSDRELAKIGIKIGE